MINYLWNKSQVRKFSYHLLAKEAEEEKQSFISINLDTKSRITTFDEIKQSIVKVDPAKKVFHNLKSKYDGEKGLEYYDKEENANGNNMKSCIINEILIKGREPTSFMQECFLNEDGMTLLELLINREKYEKLKAWHDICKGNMERRDKNKMKGILVGFVLVISFQRHSRIWRRRKSKESNKRKKFC